MMDEVLEKINKMDTKEKWTRYIYLSVKEDKVGLLDVLEIFEHMELNKILNKTLTP